MGPLVMSCIPRGPFAGAGAGGGVPTTPSSAIAVASVVIVGRWSRNSQRSSKLNSSLGSQQFRGPEQPTPLSPVSRRVAIAIPFRRVSAVREKQLYDR